MQQKAPKAITDQSGFSIMAAKVRNRRIGYGGFIVMRKYVEKLWLH
jgi:hypothetical protein